MKAASTLEFALVGLLAQKPQSGYDLRKTFATTGMRHYSDSPGSIYPALKRLEARGSIEPAEAQTDARQRRLYRLTAAGRAEFVAWIGQPVTREAVRTKQHELMLRFAYMDGNVESAVSEKFLETLANEMALYAAELRAQWTAMHAAMPLHSGVLAFQFGIEGMEAHAIWAQRALALRKERS